MHNMWRAASAAPMTAHEVFHPDGAQPESVEDAEAPKTKEEYKALLRARGQTQAQMAAVLSRAQAALKQ